MPPLQWWHGVDNLAASVVMKVCCVPFVRCHVALVTDTQIK